MAITSDSALQKHNDYKSNTKEIINNNWTGGSFVRQFQGV